MRVLFIYARPYNYLQFTLFHSFRIVCNSVQAGRWYTTDIDVLSVIIKSRLRPMKTSLYVFILKLTLTRNQISMYYKVRFVIVNHAPVCAVEFIAPIWLFNIHVFIIGVVLEIWCPEVTKKAALHMVEDSDIVELFF